MKIWTRATLLYVSLLFSSGFPAVLAETPDTYTRQKKASKEEKIWVSYSVEVIRDGKLANASSSYAFRKGDDVRVHVQTNKDGYMYILSSGADRGSYEVIYPLPGTYDKLKKGQDYRLPEKGIRIKNSSSPKSLKMVFSLKRIDIDDTRTISMKGISAPSPLEDTSAGTPSKLKPPPGFAQDSSTTLMFSNSEKPLGIELTLNGKK